VCSCPPQSGPGQARKRPRHSLLDKRSARPAIEETAQIVLVIAKSLSPMKMAASYCALLSASCRHSRRNFSILDCEEAIESAGVDHWAKRGYSSIMSRVQSGKVGWAHRETQGRQDQDALKKRYQAQLERPELNRREDMHVS
jgi:hypothetical protein